MNFNFLFFTLFFILFSRAQEVKTVFNDEFIKSCGINNEEYTTIKNSFSKYIKDFDVSTSVNYWIINEKSVFDYPDEDFVNLMLESQKENLSILKADFLGNYHGIQPSYNMKNQYGDDMIIGGQKIQVPSIDFKFLIKEDNVVSLQQINLDDNSRIYYDGIYKILLNEGNTTKIECSLSDGQTSNPTYVLLINNIDKKGTCTGNNEPEFIVQKK
jgi:hypothetical protein